MQITRDFSCLFSGENLSRKISFFVGTENSDKKAKLGFITPGGCIYFTGELALSDGKGEFLLPSALLDCKGMLLTQLFSYDDTGFLLKSSIEEIPVYPSLDDTECPLVPDETKKSLALLFEYLEGKAEARHFHDDRYFTREQVTELLKNSLSDSHDHDGRYYTEGETDELISGAVQNAMILVGDLREITETGLASKSDKEHAHSYLSLSDIPGINGVPLTGDRDINEIMFRRVLNSSDDCDAVFEDGWYVYSTSSVPKNAPFPNAAVIEVFGADSTTTQKIQRAYRYGEGGHTAFRPLYSGKWASWCVSDDFVVEKGTTGKWNYRKWYSGLSEAWGTAGITLAKDAYDWGNGIYCASGFCPLPSGVFTSVTSIHATPLLGNHVSASARVTAGLNIEANVFGKGSGVTSLKTGGTVEFNCTVTGRWK